MNSLAAKRGLIPLPVGGRPQAAMEGGEEGGEGVLAREGRGFPFFPCSVFLPPPSPPAFVLGGFVLAAAKKPPLFKTQSLPVLFSFFLPLISFHSRLFVVFFSENMAASSGYVSSSFRLRLRFVSCPSFRFSIVFSFYLGRCVGFALVVLMLGFTCIVFHLFVVLVLFFFVHLGSGFWFYFIGNLF